jgi:hypothetical protein
MFELNTLKSKKLSDLQEIAKSIGLKGVSAQKKTRFSISNYRSSVC